MSVQSMVESKGLCRSAGLMGGTEANRPLQSQYGASSFSAMHDTNMPTSGLQPASSSDGQGVFHSDCWASNRYLSLRGHHRIAPEDMGVMSVDVKRISVMNKDQVVGDKAGLRIARIRESFDTFTTAGQAGRAGQHSARHVWMRSLSAAHATLFAVMWNLITTTSLVP
ncbi:hypothetical protein AXG93_2515s1130 [Marchantia polymorpha subsp. ruderalis]|uniref:Uncharacterized protein n=1 Tax=Marchantia polymorpha subsp. ruderalis TaxID=1480154 RepID=A0A176W715_MARPO|nr:hypothetical protein AXG93_2515s1130 [Marchantia polymorpha subsp. ruderalis]